MKTKIFCDSADYKTIKFFNNKNLVDGFTTNPSLMRLSGAKNYKDYSLKILKICKRKPISFEVFADNPKEMLKQAYKINKWGKNVYVKIPVVNSKGFFMGPVIRELSRKGIKLNITAVYTFEQTVKIFKCLNKKTKSIISIFAGRMADKGKDPLPIFKRSIALTKKYKNIEILWASTREAYNFIQAKQLGCNIITMPPKVINQISTLEKLARESNILVIALPPIAAAQLIPKLAAVVDEHCIVTDVASVKSTIMDVVNEQPLSFQQRFVPGHPIAGSEQSEFQSSTPELFRDRNVILIPHTKINPKALAVVNELWRELGANILGMELAKHDEVLAMTSHLPHLLAYTIVDVLVGQQQSEDIFRYAAGGFADFSRLASSNAKMWSDIFVTNSDAMILTLDSYIERLQEFKKYIANQDHSLLMRKLSNAKDVRDDLERISDIKYVFLLVKS